MLGFPVGHNDYLWFELWIYCISSNILHLTKFFTNKQGVLTPSLSPLKNWTQIGNRSYILHNSKMADENAEICQDNLFEGPETVKKEKNAHNSEDLPNV